MLSFLKNHPFAVEAFFKSSFVVTFATPKEGIAHLIPEGLQLDTFKDRWAFIAVAMVQTKHLRPKGLPRFFGSDFFLIGYRIFVRYTDVTGRSLRGLYILKSVTDSKRMEFFGNLLTHYKYTTENIEESLKDGIVDIRSGSSDMHVAYKEPTEEELVSLPAGSPFADWKEARKFAGPLPFTFTFDAASKTMLIIEGVRQNWKPIPVEIIDYSFPFIDQLDLGEIRLANAFLIRNVPYHWKKGRREPLK